VTLCVIRVRRNMGDELEYGYVMPLFPLFPIAAIACQVAMAGGIFAESWIAWAIALVWVPAGAVIYLIYSRTRVATAEHEIRVLEEARAPEAGGYRIMVAVANPDSALELVRNTYKLCGAKEARVELLHMVPVPDQVPLADAGRHMLEGKEAIVETMLYLAPQFAISTTIRYCRNVARGIVSAVREKRIDLLIMGWHGRARSRGFNLGSTLDPVIERVPCNVLILKECGGDLRRSAVELAKDWRTDRVLRRLEAMLLVADRKHMLLISGTGDVVDPEEDVIAIGSGGSFAYAAARAFLESGSFSAREVVERSLRIATEICIYTNSELVVEELA